MWQIGPRPSCVRNGSRRRPRTAITSDLRRTIASSGSTGRTTLGMRCPLALLATSEAFLQADEAAFLSLYDDLTADSYAAPLPPDLVAACAAKGKAQDPLPSVVVLGDRKTSELGEVCGPSVACHVEGRVEVDANWDVGALVVTGEVAWTTDDLWLCAGYVAVEKNGAFVAEGKGTIYVKNNGATHAVLRTRAVGSVAAGGSPRLEIRGRERARTWSLLATPASIGDDVLELVHDAEAMGWSVGDRVAVAPTAPRSQGTSESFTILDIDGSKVRLSAPLKAPRRAFYEAMPTHAVAVAAEVVNLSRDFVITGDDFEEVACDPALSPDDAGKVSDGGESHSDGCLCTAEKTSCTVGLHTIAIGGGTHEISRARVEKCGQRGVFGKYCAHFHEMGACPSCKFDGNAIEFGMQRAVVVHNTHLSLVRGNVVHDVRGAALYVQDGLESWNRFEYNVVICPRGTADHGCAVPGTDNAQADTAVNNAGYWAVSATQDLIGNRFAPFLRTTNLIKLIITHNNRQTTSTACSSKRTRPSPTAWAARTGTFARAVSASAASRATRSTRTAASGRTSSARTFPWRRTGRWSPAGRRRRPPARPSTTPASRAAGRAVSATRWTTATRSSGATSRATTSTPSTPASRTSTDSTGRRPSPSPTAAPVTSPTR